uniref:Polyprotein n=1 Tax=Cajanus cajan TaxID=3821 RepID=A0A151SUS3_CAJCA|nr:polyprotein [Cajanus cajan]
MKPGSIPLALIYRIQYKVMNSISSKVYKPPEVGTTTFFLTDFSKANVVIPVSIKWEDVTLPDSWTVTKAVTLAPRPTPEIQEINQHPAGEVTITFVWSTMNRYTIDKPTLHKEFYYEEEDGFLGILRVTHRSKIIDLFYTFLENVQTHVCFFDWFNVYLFRNKISPPWITTITEDLSVNMLTVWHRKDGKLVKSDLPPNSSYFIPNLEDKYMASPFKYSDETIGAQDIKALMEQNNYTNKYLQVLGENLVSKASTSGTKESEAQSVTKPLFKPANLTSQTRNKFITIRQNWTRTLEYSNKDNSVIIPETPSTSQVGSIKTGPITRTTAPDLLLEEKNDQSFRSFSATNIYEWNIDGLTEYNILNTLQHMTMVSTAYQTALDSADEAIVEILTSGFSGQLKGWWDNYVYEIEKHEILTAFKTDVEGNIITEKGEPILEAVNTLIMAIVKHFIGDPRIWKDQLLFNLKCRTLGDFRWNKATFLTRVYTRDDSNQPFWKEKFLAELPKSLGDKVREKIRTQFNGDIPYSQLSYGSKISIQLISATRSVQKQLAKEKSQNRKDLGNFCQQFGLPCSKNSTKTKPRKPRKSSQPQQSKYHKPRTKFSRETRTCFKCGRQGHLAKFCRISSKVRELNLDPTLLDQLNNLFINSSDSDEEDKQSSSKDIQADDDLSSSDESFESPLINFIHNDEQNLLLDALKSIQDPHERDEYLEKLKNLLHKPKSTHSDNRFVNNKFDLTQTLKRLEKSSAKPVTIHDIQTDIYSLKFEVRDLKKKQHNHSDQNTNEDDDLFTALINQCSIQKFYIDVTILIDDFTLNTVALFDTGADSNCILEGLIPTKYFHKTSEKLRTASGSRLEIRYKLPSTIIKNDRLIRKSKSPWSYAAFYVNKASEIERGAPRLVINYKPLNQALQWIRYPIPNKKDLLACLHSAKIFSKFDMKSRFWQIQINPSDRYKTAFTVSLKKSPPSWTDVHTNLVRQIKLQVKVLPCLYLPNPNLFKIVETDTSDIGYGGVLKQRMHNSENCIPFTSKHWNKAQHNYSTIKKEVLAFVLCISKFQSDLLNQKILVKVDCKYAKEILQKDVNNLASKQIFARWQAILSVFYFEIEYIKGTSNNLPDYLTREFLQGQK